MKKAALPEENAALTGTHCTATSKRGRRAISSLWFAVRTIHGAQLTPDDLAILREALADLHGIVEGQP